MPSNGLYSMFGTNKNFEVTDGIDLRYGEAVFTVRRAGGSNLKYQSELRRLLRPVQKRWQQDSLPEEEFQKIIMRAHARAVMLKWENVTGADGKPIPFTEDNFVKLMIDLPDLWDVFSDACSSAANFRSEQIATDGDALGN